MTRTLRVDAIKRRSRVLAVVGAVLAMGMITTVTTAAASAGPRHDALSPVIQATRKFHRVGAATKAGYAQFTDVNGITCINGPVGQGNMGIHYVNSDLVGDGKIDPTHPEAVLYQPTSNGLQLTAVEYIVLATDWKSTTPPALFGHTFMLIPAPNRYGLPNFYALHIWLWKNNPSGTFHPWNPDIPCPS